MHIGGAFTSPRNIASALTSCDTIALHAAILYMIEESIARVMIALSCGELADRLTTDNY